MAPMSQVKLTKAPPVPLARRVRSFVNQCRIHLHQVVTLPIHALMWVLLVADRAAEYILPKEYRHIEFNEEDGDSA